MEAGHEHICMCVNGVLISGQNTQFEKFRILPAISVLLYIILSYGYSSKSGQDSQFLNYNVKVSAEQRPHESRPSYTPHPPPRTPHTPCPVPHPHSSLVPLCTTSSLLRVPLVRCRAHCSPTGRVACGAIGADTRRLASGDTQADSKKKS